MHAAFEDGTVVGGAGAFTFDCRVPGGSLPCAGVTVVGTYPTHRRRGALRSMMDAQLATCTSAASRSRRLWASEETIYGRFGYGLAAWAGEVKIPRTAAAFAKPFSPRGRPRLRHGRGGGDAVPAGVGGARPAAAGRHSRSAAWWELRALRMPHEQTANPKRFVVARARRPSRRPMRSTGRLLRGGRERVQRDARGGRGGRHDAAGDGGDLAVSPRHRLDRPRSKASLLPPDHPLFLLLANPRRA